MCGIVASQRECLTPRWRASLGCLFQILALGQVRCQVVLPRGGPQLTHHRKWNGQYQHGTGLVLGFVADACPNWWGISFNLSV